MHFLFADGRTVRITVSGGGKDAKWSVGRGELTTQGDVGEFLDAYPKAQLIGSWQKVTPRITMIKHLTPVGFAWVHFENETKNPIASAGGAWSLDGDTYCEQVQYATDNFKHLRGKEFRFQFRVENDQLHMLTRPGTGIYSKETWDKVK